MKSAGAVSCAISNRTALSKAAGASAPAVVLLLRRFDRQVATCAPFAPRAVIETDAGDAQRRQRQHHNRRRDAGAAAGNNRPLEIHALANENLIQLIHSFQFAVNHQIAPRYVERAGNTFYK